MIRALQSFNKLQTDQDIDSKRQKGCITRTGKLFSHVILLTEVLVRREGYNGMITGLVLKVTFCTHLRIVGSGIPGSAPRWKPEIKKKVLFEPIRYSLMEHHTHNASYS